MAMKTLVIMIAAAIGVYGEMCDVCTRMTDKAGMLDEKQEGKCPGMQECAGGERCVATRVETAIMDNEIFVNANNCMPPSSIDSICEKISDSLSRVATEPKSCTASLVADDEEEEEDKREEEKETTNLCNVCIKSRYGDGEPIIECGGEVKCASGFQCTTMIAKMEVFNTKSWMKITQCSPPNMIENICEQFNSTVEGLTFCKAKLVGDTKESEEESSDDDGEEGQEENEEKEEKGEEKKENKSRYIVKSNIQGRKRFRMEIRMRTKDKFQKRVMNKMNVSYCGIDLKNMKRKLVRGNRAIVLSGKLKKMCKTRCLKIEIDGETFQDCV